MGTDPVITRLTEELADTCRKAFQRGLVGGAGGNISVRLPDRDEALMERHGMFSLGPNLTVAYNLADLVEDTAKIALLSRLIPE